MPSNTSELQRFAFVAKATLGLLKTYVQKAYPVKGQTVLDSPELSAVVSEAKCLLKLILSTLDPGLSADGTSSPVSAVVSICREAFLACFDAFYPSLPLKWYALCEEIQSVDPVSVESCLQYRSVNVFKNLLFCLHQSYVFAGMPKENLLSTVLEALSGPAVSYIGLSYDAEVALASGWSPNVT